MREDSLGSLLGNHRLKPQVRLRLLLRIAMEFYQDGNCPGHVASSRDPRLCGRCGVHIDELRSPEED